MLGADRRPGRHPGGDRDRRRHLRRRSAHQPRPVLPRLRRLPRPHRRGARAEHAADRARGRLGAHRPAAGPRPVVLDSDDLDPRRDRHRHVRHPDRPTAHRGAGLAVLRDPGPRGVPAAAPVGAVTRGQRRLLGWGAAGLAAPPRRWCCSSRPAAPTNPGRRARSPGLGRRRDRDPRPGRRCDPATDDHLRHQRQRGPAGLGGPADRRRGHAGLWQAKVPTAPDQPADQVTLGELAVLAGGRLPWASTPTRPPAPSVCSGPPTPSTASGRRRLAGQRGRGQHAPATLSGGGLRSTKTVSVGGLGSDWSVPEPQAAAAAAAVAGAATDRAEHMLWRRLAAHPAHARRHRLPGRRDRARPERSRREKGKDSGMLTQLRGTTPASRRRWHAAPTLLAASALALSACGSSPSGGVPPRPRPPRVPRPDPAP